MNRKGNTALTHLVLGMAALLCAPASAFAADTPLTQEQGSILWTLLGGMLVMFMQPGFALVECGLTRAKNAANIMLKNYADFMLGS
ncbi:MAG: ammonium transporter, partial [Desulfovibrionaceae bacterium]|nr:ammonium transporter [Desulfovibrionaceae bacterium]